MKKKTPSGYRAAALVGSWGKAPVGLRGEAPYGLQGKALIYLRVQGGSPVGSWGKAPVGSRGKANGGFKRAKPLIDKLLFNKISTPNQRVQALRLVILIRQKWCDHITIFKYADIKNSLIANF